MDRVHHDLIVVGAGIYGLQALRTYLDIHSSAKVAVLEADDGAGGVWSKQRFYPGFWTQVGFGCGEFSDRPMRRPRNEDMRYGLFDAKYVHEYIEDYLDNHIYEGLSLRDRIRCGFYVEAVSKVDGLWHVRGRGRNGSKEVYTAPKIIIGSGNTSIPNVPHLPNHGFQGHIIHIKDYGQHASQLLSGPLKNVTVLGGGKSAADLAFSVAQAGHNVSWIVRRSGHGPGVFAVPQEFGPYRNPVDVMLTRFGGTLSPSHLQPYTWWMWFLHTTWLGQLLLLLIFRVWGLHSYRHAKWDVMANARKGYNLLRPDSDGFFLNAPIGIIQNQDFWPTLAQRVEVYREDIDSLHSNGIHLADSEKTIIPCDILLLGTGFKSRLPFFGREEHVRLELSHEVVHGNDEGMWNTLCQTADDEISQRFPLLGRSHKTSEVHATTPMRLYNTIAPLHDQSIAFVGFISVVNNFLGAECQALWATSWIDNSPLLKVPSIAQMQLRIAYDSQWSRKRYPYAGGTSGTTYDLEGVLYGDRLLAELGLKSHVKNLTWWQYWFGVNYQSRYAGLVAEYKARSLSQRECASINDKANVNVMSL